MSKVARHRHERTLTLFSVAAALSFFFFGPLLTDLETGPLGLPQGAEVVAWYRAQAAPFFRRYMRADGRIVDVENGGITHSEGQAYAMQIAYFADDPVVFERVWAFTRRNLKRSDDLFAWRYSPERGVTDTNDATDADLIISATLALAARRWGREDYFEQAKRTAQTIGRRLLATYDGKVLLLPGVEGFGTGQPDSPVVNLSYYDFGAIDIVEQLAPRYR